MIPGIRYSGPQLPVRSQTTVLDSDGNQFSVGNAIVNSDGNIFRVSSTVLDSDGNPFTIFT